MRRFLALMLVLLLVFSMIPSASAAYENTYTNTGDQRRDIIQVALTQVGYREGWNNDTKYGDWYGLPNHPWCAMFVSWCANQARIPTSVIKKAAIASPTYFGFSSYFTASARMPQSGDLFFKKGFTHVGLVYYVDGNYFYTVEGNTNNSGSSEGVGVFIQRRRLSDCYFASPNYTTDPGHGYKTGYEASHPHREYKSCSHCGDFYYTGNNVVLSDCPTCIIENCTHSYSAWSKNGGTHKRVCSICGKEETADHRYSGGTVTKYATCGTVGYMDQTCSDCGQMRTVALPATNEHKYTQWELVNQEVHKRSCTVCKQVERVLHELPEEYEFDASDHWKTCADCNEVIGKEYHEFGPECGDPCTVCGYVPPNGHVFVNYSSTEEGHWRSCANCSATEQIQPHVFDADCDALCDACGFERPASHVYTDDYSMDASGHWKVCTLCQGSSAIQAHVPGEEATEEHAQVCTECGLELKARLAHVHRYEPYQTDYQNHWGTCRCGEVLEPQAHIWDMDTGLCSTCGYEPTMPEKSVNWDPLWIPIFAVPSISLVSILQYWRVKRRKEKILYS